jgi:DNA repair exonuclease SbcCD ATPase subunit
MKKQVVIRKASIKFQPVEIPHLRIVDIDLTQKKSVALVKHSDFAQYRDCVVKPVIKFYSDDVESAVAVYDNFSDKISSYALSVQKPKMISIRVDEKKIPELRKELSPGECFDIWWERNPLARVKKEDVWKVFESFFGTLKIEDKKKVARFRITKINAENFMPFDGKNKVTKIGKGVIGIVAKYDGMDGCSNRAGKTAFMKVILTALFGESRKDNSKGDTFESDIYGDRDFYRVGVRVRVGTEYRDIERVRYRDGKNEILIDGNLFKKDDADKELIEEFLRINRNDFVKSAFVRPKDLHGIIDSSSADMKETFIKWLGIDYWMDLNKLAKEKMDGLHTEIDHTKRIIAEYKKVMKEEVDEELLERDQKELDQLVADKGRKKENAVVVKDDYNRLLKLIKSRDFVNGAKTVFDMKTDIQHFQKMMNLIRLKISEGEKKYGKVQSDIQKLSDTKIGLKGGKCPVDAKKCPRSKELMNWIEDNKTALQLMSEKESILSDSLEKKVREVRSYENQMYHETTFLNTVEEAKRQLKDGKDILSREKEIVKRWESNQENVIDNDEQIATLRFSVDDRKYLLRSKKEAETEIEVLRDKKADLECSLNVVKYIHFMTSKNGIPLIQIENAKDEIEDYSNLVLEKMEATHRVRFNFRKPQKKKEDFCSDCGGDFEDGKCITCDKERGVAYSDDFSLRILDGSREQSFGKDSSGGQDLVALALRVALSKFLGVRLLFLDEVCGSLDEKNLQMLIKLIQWLPDFGFDQVFIISHRPQISDSIERNVLITRFVEDSRSEFFWEE